MANVWTATRADATTLTLGDGDPYWTEGFEPYKASDIRNSDQDTPDGQVAGFDIESGRPMSMTVGFGNYFDRAQVQEDFEALDAFFRPSSEDIQMTWALGDEAERTRWVRSRGVDDLTDDDTLWAEDGTRVTFRAPDPRTYGAEITHTIDASETVSIGGLRPTRRWLFVVTGACAAPVFTAQRGDGAVFTVTGPTLVSGDRWEVDGVTGDNRHWVNATSTYQYFNGGVVQPIKAGSGAFTFTRSSGASTGVLTIRPAY